MLQAYVGLVTPQGLELLCPEHPETVRFLERRVARSRGGAACFWTVAPDDAIAPVQAALDAGERQIALHLLQQATQDGGPLFPAPEEPSGTWIIRADR